MPDWSAGPLLETEQFASSTVYDALNRPIQVVAPHAAGSRASIVQPTYNEAALLEKLDVWPRFEGEPPTLLDGAEADLHAVTNLDYNAKGQRVLIEYGNGVRTGYDYDPLTFRLLRLHTRRGGHPLQDLSYTFDPAGNITHLRDDAQETIFFRNRAVEPSADYTYDALYRLIAATGREHLGQSGGDPEPTSWTDAPRVGLPQPGDGAAMGRYRERYEYDEVGNFLRMIHHGEPHASGGWTRAYRYEEPSQLDPSQVSNRLTATQTGHHAAERYRYDADGNMTAISHLSLMQWDFRDQLQAVAQQAADDDATRETTYYVYDGGGQRVRKVTERAGGTKERLYLGGFEVYRERDAEGAVELERETLHVMDGKQRVALIETRTQGSDPAPAELVRFQLGNHLDSAVLELDAQARVISYEEYYSYGSTSYQAVRGRTETPKRYRYTGKERDEESGFYYHGARYYAPWLGRWASADPSGLVDGTNRYHFGKDNPIRFTDPSGREGADKTKPEEAPKKEVKAEDDKKKAKPLPHPPHSAVNLSLTNSAGSTAYGVFDSEATGTFTLQGKASKDPGSGTSIGGGILAAGRYGVAKVDILGRSYTIDTGILIGGSTSSSPDQGTSKGWTLGGTAHIGSGADDTHTFGYGAYTSLTLNSTTPGAFSKAPAPVGSLNLVGEAKLSPKLTLDANLIATGGKGLQTNTGVTLDSSISIGTQVSVGYAATDQWTIAPEVVGYKVSGTGQADSTGYSPDVTSLRGGVGLGVTYVRGNEETPLGLDGKPGAKTFIPKQTIGVTVYGLRESTQVATPTGTPNQLNNTTLLVNVGVAF